MYIRNILHIQTKLAGNQDQQGWNLRLQNLQTQKDPKRMETHYLWLSFTNIPLVEAVGSYELLFIETSNLAKWQNLLVTSCYCTWAYHHPLETSRGIVTSWFQPIWIRHALQVGEPEGTRHRFQAKKNLEMIQPFNDWKQNLSEDMLFPCRIPRNPSCSKYSKWDSHKRRLENP